LTSARVGGLLAATMTVANQISIVRILLIPFVVGFLLGYSQSGHDWQRWMVIALFALASISDGIDGYIARRWKQQSELGTILDPMADKLLLVSCAVCLSLDTRPHLEPLPLWLAVTVISRDVILTGWLLLMRYARRRAVVRPSWFGKTATVLQMAVILWTLLKWDAAWQWKLALAAAVTTGISGVLYVLDGLKQLSAPEEGKGKAE
jgi:cardiolipin synthase (CMP-forming)